MTHTKSQEELLALICELEGKLTAKQTDNYWFIKLYSDNLKLVYALKEIRSTLNKECGIMSNAKAVGIINEVLGEN